MSTKDGKVLETSSDAVDRESNGDSRSGGNGGGGWILLFFVLGLVASLVIGWGVFPMLLYSKKEQPIAFNHRMHVQEVDNGCQSCHYLRADGTFSGIPTLADCMTCHEEPIGESEQEALLMEQYVYKGREIPWLVYARQPDCVFFSHAAHLRMARLDCQTCHGDIGESTHPRAYQENRITGVSRDVWGHNIAGFKKNTWDRMKMDDCTDCHDRMTGRRTSVQTGHDACFVCHK